MPTLVYTKSGGNFTYVTTSGTSTITGDTYVRYTTTDNNGSWIRVHIPVPLGHTYNLTQIYTEYTSAVGTTTLKGEFQYGIIKEKRDVYDYDKNSSFTYTVARGTYGSSAGNTYTASTSLALDSGDWYLYIFVVKSGYSFQYVTTNDTKLQLTYTDNITDYIISYNANGGTGTMPITEVPIGSPFNLPSNTFTAPSSRLYTTTLDGNGGNNGIPTYRANTFYRWRLNSTSGTPYEANTSYTPTANSTFYAEWYTPTVLNTTTRGNSTQNGYTVSFNANGGSCSTSSLTATDTLSHTFKEWNSSRNGDGATWSSTATYIMTSNHTLYAIWNSSISAYGSIDLPSASKSNETLTRTVTLNANGGDCSTSSLNSTSTISYTFKGWNTISSATTGITGKYTPEESLTLYAIFSSTQGAFSSVNLPTPTRAGFEFLGWAESTSASEGITGAYTPSKSITLYAIWKRSGTVRIYIDGQGYKMAQVYLFTTSDNKWHLTVPYLYDGSWRISS